MSLNAKLFCGAALIALATTYLAYLGAASSWRYYVMVDECVENPTAYQGHRLRVNGRVAPNSLQIRADRKLATFALVGDVALLEVTCPGPLPDNLAEDMEVVVEGKLVPGNGLQLQGDKVLTRCASKYQAQEAS